MNQLENIINPNNLYIAHQNTSSLDEIQRMAISYKNQHPVALEGNPGTGKNHAINIVAKAFEKKEYRVRCTEEMMARDIIGGEKLSAEKGSRGGIATKTKFYKGKLMQAMYQGEIAILDEFNQLLPTVQKGLNSALEDYKTIDGLEGGHETKSKNGFGLFITYNPDTGVDKFDIEPAVKNRCKLVHFDDLRADIKTYIAMISTGNLSVEEIVDSGILEVRGIGMQNNKLTFGKFDGYNWIDLNSEEEISAKGLTSYLFHDTHSRGELYFDSEKKTELHRVTKSIVDIFENLEILRTKGTIPFTESSDFRNLNSISRLNINPSSPRIVNKLVEDYQLMKSMNVSNKNISSDLVLSIIDYAVNPAERYEEIGDDTTLSNFVEQICARKGLLTAHAAQEIKTRTLAAAKKGAINAFINQGLTQEVSEQLVEEYINYNPIHKVKKHRKEKRLNSSQEGHAMEDNDQSRQHREDDDDKDEDETNIPEDDLPF